MQNIDEEVEAKNDRILFRDLGLAAYCYQSITMNDTLALQCLSPIVKSLITLLRSGTDSERV